MPYNMNGITIYGDALTDLRGKPEPGAPALRDPLQVTIPSLSYLLPAGSRTP